MPNSNDENESDYKYPMHERVHGDDVENPRYLKPSDPETWEKPEDVDTWGDWMLRPDRPLLQRHLELCRMAAHGKTNNEIAEKLNYSSARVSVLLSNSRIRDQIQLYRDQLFGIDVKTRMKELAPDALNVIQGILNDDRLSVKEKEKAAIWVIEKVDGKAAQQTDINVTGGIGVFLDQLDRMKRRGETLDVTPRLNAVTPDQESGELIQSGEGKSEKAEVDTFSAWLDANLETKSE